MDISSDTWSVKVGFVAAGAMRRAPTCATTPLPPAAARLLREHRPRLLTRRNRTNHKPTRRVVTTRRRRRLGKVPDDDPACCFEDRGLHGGRPVLDRGDASPLASSADVILVNDPGLADYRDVLERRYANDPFFVYPDIGILGKMLSGRSAFLARGRLRAFSVRDERGRPGAFAAAFVDPGLQEKTGKATASIGFFEAVDMGAALKVLEAACGWLAEQGTIEAWASFNANPYYRMGVREDRFDEPPFIACAHDPPSTREFLGAAGIDRVNRYLNFEIDLARRPWEGVGLCVSGAKMRPLSRHQFRRDVLSYVHLHNAAFRTVWGEVEISDAEALQLLMRSRLALDPRLLQFATLDADDVGFVLCVSNLGEVLAPLRAPLTSPRGIAKMARRRRRARTAGLLSLGVRPDLQGRGIGSALVARALRNASDIGFERVEYALVAENNEASRAIAARFGGNLCRSFGIYARNLG